VSHEYLFPIALPPHDAAEHVLRRAADALGEAITDPDVAPVVYRGDLAGYAFDADAGGRTRSTRALGFGADAMLALVDVGQSSSDRMRAVFADVLRAVLAFTGVAGTQAVLLEELNDDSLILRIDDGRLTLNERWPGWLVWPEVVSVIPEPRFAELGFPR
jgi:hypothetical protein